MTSAPVSASSRQLSRTSAPACTTALVTSSLAMSVASWPARVVRCSVPGSARSVHSASAARTRARADPGARGPPDRVASARAHACADASEAAREVSRCVGMPHGQLPDCSYEYTAINAARVTDRPYP
ncbi:hypothetical protein SHIRM173S_11465 [Streptomyces hirsutus]